MIQGAKLKSDKYTKLWEGDNDKLGTNFFAEELGKFILDYDETDSLVIGLCGEWGSGKTSIIKSTLNYIEKEKHIEKSPINRTIFQKINRFFIKFVEILFRIPIDNNKPILIEFNPWNFSNQDQLISQFFKEMIVKLERTDYDSLKKTAQRLELYAGFFESLGMGFPPLRVATRAIKNYIISIKDYSGYKLNDLDEIKEELDKTLKNQGHKIIIFIDDIDRLNKSEIRQIFQLVKSLADFPNTVYILAFDKEIVINSLKNIQKDVDPDSINTSENHGLRYLEKVVQVILEVPKISRIEIKSLLKEQLEKLTKNEEWNEEQWDYYIQNGIVYFFKNIRDVKRYFNTLIFSFGLLKDEVNWPDLFAITAFQVFIPEVYNDIKYNKEFFAGDLKYNNSISENERRKFVEKTINKGSNKIPKEKLLILLKRLFPTLHKLYEDDLFRIPGEDYNKRIFHLDMFDTYFRLSVPEWKLSLREFNYLIETAYNIELFTNELLELIKDNNNKKIIKFLELLQDSNLNIPEKNIKNIIEGIISISDLINLNVAYDRQTKNINDALIHLGKSLNKKERFNAFKTAIKNSDSLYFSPYFLENTENRNSRLHTEFFSEKQLGLLKREFVNKIKNSAESGKLWETRDPLAFLDMWAEWGEKEDVNTFMDNLDIDSLLKFLFHDSIERSFLDSEANDLLNTMDNIMDLKILKSKLEETKDSLDDEDLKNLVNRFIKPLNDFNL